MFKDHTPMTTPPQPPPTSNRAGRMVSRIFRMLFLTPFGGEFVEFKGLSISLRLLTGLGYAAIFILLGMVLILEVFRPNMAMITFVPPATDSNQTEVPLLALIFACAAFCLGWGYILTAIRDCGKRVFIPVVLLFIVQIFFFMPRGSLAGMGIWCLSIFLVCLGLGLVYFLSRRWSRWCHEYESESAMRSLP